MMTVLRSVLFNIAFWGMTTIAGVLALPLLAGPRRWLIRPMRLYAQAVVGMLRLICGIHFRIVGLDRLPRSGAALIAARHESAFDTFIWFALLPDAAYVLKRELQRVPVWGWYAWKAKQISVDRSAGGSAMRHLLRSAKAALAEDRQVVIFPEGTRVAPGERLAFQPGIAALATSTGMPVIPVATDSGRCWGRRAFIKRPGTITITLLPPIPPGMKREALLARLESVIWAAGGEPSQPVDKPVESLGQAVGR